MRGRVSVSAVPRNSAMMNSLMEMMNANSAPTSTDGAVNGRITV